jgi:hypothetical protein
LDRWHFQQIVSSHWDLQFDPKQRCQLLEFIEEVVAVVEGQSLVGIA